MELLYLQNHFPHLTEFFVGTDKSPEPRLNISPTMKTTLVYVDTTNEECPRPLLIILDQIPRRVPGLGSPRELGREPPVEALGEPQLALFQLVHKPSVNGY